MKVAGLRGDGPAPVERPTLPSSLADDAGPPARSVPWWLAGAAVAVIAAGVVLRFWTRSDLWLDEALTVNIARLPIGQIAGALRHDGSPPLYYYLLHFWMRAFGQGDLAVRSLSGVLGVATLPVGWLAGRRIGGRPVAWATLLLVASSPFAVRYSTENRMYMLIVLLTAVGYLAVTSALERPTVGRLAGVALTTGLLLLCHYWTLYLVGAVLLVLAWVAARGRHHAGAARRVVLAVVGGFLLLVPWVGILAFQLRHTGTPWSEPANFSAMVNAVSDFAGGGTNQGRALGLVFFGLAGVGLFGAAVDGHRIELDLRTRPRARAVAFVSAAALALAIVAGLALRSAFTARYAAVVFIPFVLLVALGMLSFADVRVRRGVLAAAVVFGLAGSVTNVTTNRTEVGKIAAAIRQSAAPGDVVVYCPDQLGPSTSRLLPAGAYRQVVFPTGAGPARVDWVDYAARNKAADPAAFARRVQALAAGHQVWLVWANDYRTFEGKCDALESSLAVLRPHSAAVLLAEPAHYFEHAGLVRYWPA
ncbi:MAG TPA: glycosyltransferase family 39 protein [Acidimicrobiales bacterium]|nr:glycosyltransferase family 39 protein [Acidimicrobiales bacterium]